MDKSARKCALKENQRRSIVIHDCSIQESNNSDGGGQGVNYNKRQCDERPVSHTEDETWRRMAHRVACPLRSTTKLMHGNNTQLIASYIILTEEKTLNNRFDGTAMRLPNTPLSC